MVQLNQALLFALANVGFIQSWCAPWNQGGAISLFKEVDFKGQSTVVVSSDSCQNTNGVWKSGKSNGNYQCTIHRSKDCEGDSHSVDSAGYRRPGWEIQSIKCPCV